MIVPTRRGRAGAALLACALLFAGAVPVGSAADPVTVAFDESEVREHAGDVARIVVDYAGRSVATVTVRGHGLNASVAVVDLDGDGTAVLRVNTYARGPDGTRFSSVGDDAVSVVDPGNVDGRLPAGEYALALRPGRTTAGDPVQVGTLTLERPRVRGVTAFVAPARAYDDLDSPAAVRRAILTPSDAVAMDGAYASALVLRVRASGLGRALAAANGTDPSARFRALEAAGVVDLTAVQRDPGPSHPPKTLALPGPGARVVPDPRRDAYYVVADPAALNVTYRRAECGDRGCPAVRPGDRYRVTAAYPRSSPLAVDGREAAVATVAVADGFVAFEDRRRLPATDDASLVARTNYAPGTALAVRVSAANGTVDRNATVAVVAAGDGRALSVPLNLSDVPDGTRLRATAALNGSVVAEAAATVVEPRASVAVADLRAANGTAVLNATADLSLDGFLVVRRGGRDGPVAATAVAPVGRTAATFRVNAAPGSHRLVVVAYRDADGDGAFDPGAEPFRVGGDVVSAAGTYALAGPTTATTDASTATTSAARETTAVGTPGFSALAAALSLAVARLLRRTGRRTG